MPNLKKQFDCVIMNPPYQNSLHAKFLGLALDMGQHVISIQPINWLLVDEDEQGVGDYIEVKKRVAQFKKNVRLINGNPIFQASFFMPCTIVQIDTLIEDESLTVVDISGRTWHYSNIFEFSKFGNVPECRFLVSKIETFAKRENCWTDWERTDKKGKGRFFVNLARVRGHVRLNDPIKMLDADFYTLVPREFKPSRKRGKFYHFGFASEQEAENFILYLGQKVTRFCFSINKHGSSIRRKQLQTIPWLDFTKKWTDVNLRKLFGITQKEWDFIESVIEDY